MNLSRASPAGRACTARTAHLMPHANTGCVQPGAVAVPILAEPSRAEPSRAEPSLLSDTDAGGSLEPDAPVAQMAMP